MAFNLSLFKKKKKTEAIGCLQQGNHYFPLAFGDESKGSLSNDGCHLPFFPMGLKPGGPEERLWLLQSPSEGKARDGIVWSCREWACGGSREEGCVRKWVRKLRRSAGYCWMQEADFGE